MKKYYIVFIILLVIGIGSGIYYFTDYRQSKMNLPEDVTLESHLGSAYSFKNMEPKIRLVEFMYTQCPDVCPNTTFQMKHLRNELENEGVFGKDVEFLTITFDPERDTKEVLHDYANTFEMDKIPGWHLLRGNDEDVKKLADSFNFQYRDPGTGQFVHTSATYLLNKDNEVIEVFGMGEKTFKKDKVFKVIMNELN